MGPVHKSHRLPSPQNILLEPCRSLGCPNLWLWGHFIRITGSHNTTKTHQHTPKGHVDWTESGVRSQRSLTGLGENLSLNTLGANLD